MTCLILGHKWKLNNIYLQVLYLLYIFNHIKVMYSIQVYAYFTYNLSCFIICDSQVTNKINLLVCK